MNMKVISMLPALLLAACASEKPPPRPIWINECFVRTHSERGQLMERARHGDAEACIELSNYYNFIELDEKHAIDWLRRAVELEPDNDLWRRNLRVMTTEEDEED